jgi:signal transduction histidine kinase
MTETSGETPTPLLQADADEIRRITHDINNALEVIVQASYLVNSTGLSDQAKEWMKLLDQGIQQATVLNREMRDFVRMRSGPE